MNVTNSGGGWRPSYDGADAEGPDERGGKEVEEEAQDNLEVSA